MQIKLFRRNKMYSYYMKDMVLLTTCKKAIWKTLIYFLIFIAAVLISLIPQLLMSNSVSLHSHSRFQTDMKYILIWKQLKNSKYLVNRNTIYTSGQNLFINQKCKFINCYITYNKSLLPSDEDFDAIVFDIGELRKFPNELNLTRSPHQKYIFKSLQPSDKFPLCSRDFDNFFNWTWTYKLNSDIPHPFLNILTNNKKVVGPKLNMEWIIKMDHSNVYQTVVRSKSKAVAWFVRQCKVNTKHKEFVIALRNELKGYNYTIDIFGPCGEKKCLQDNIQKCSKDYFFELVLEDATADDYVSSKIVRALQHVTIPIVLGGANYAKFLPPGSYIDVKTVDMKKLGAIIDYLIKNPKMYEYFFDWKNHYYYTSNPSNHVCDLCEKLNQSYNVSTYSKFRQWWNSNYKDICERIRLYRMFN